MRISELPQTSDILSEDMLAIDNISGTKSATFENIMKAVNSGIKIEDSVSDKFDTSVDYEIGQYCILDNRLYKFIAVKEHGPWDGTKVIPCTVSNELFTMKELIDGINGNIDILNVAQVRLVVNPENWDELGINEKAGIILSTISFGSEQASQIIGFPYGAYSYGCLVTFNSYRVSAISEGYRNAQIYFPHYNGAEERRKIYVRTFPDRTGGGVRCWRVIDTPTSTTSVLQ